MSNVRKEELTRYVELLVHLKANGVRCDDKIKEALEELHNVIIAKTGIHEVGITGRANSITNDGVLLIKTTNDSDVLTATYHSDNSVDKQSKNLFDKFA